MQILYTQKLASYKTQRITYANKQKTKSLNIIKQLQTIAKQQEINKSIKRRGRHLTNERQQ